MGVTVPLMMHGVMVSASPSSSADRPNAKLSRMAAGTGSTPTTATSGREGRMRSSPILLTRVVDSVNRSRG
jgi:hypothetical protein